jgi:hypothetical protein
MLPTRSTFHSSPNQNRHDSPGNTSHAPAVLAANVPVAVTAARR